MDAIRKAFKRVAERYECPRGMGAIHLAEDIHHLAFANEVNRSGTAKLGWDTGVLAMKTANLMGTPRAFEPLHITAAELGFICIPMPEAVNIQSNTVLQDLGWTCKEFGDLAHEVAARAADGDISDNDLAVIEKEWAEVMATGGAMLSHVRSMNLAKKPLCMRPAPSAAVLAS